MVNQTLTDFSIQKFKILLSINNKKAKGAYNQSLHDLFKNPSKHRININDIENIISAIEIKLRNIETIYYTYFDLEYDSSIIINNSMSSNKIIETEFTFNTNIIKNRIEINDARIYKELIDTNFQTFILDIAALYEVLVKLNETLLKKIVLYDGEKLPYQSIPFKLFLMNWDKLVELGYRKNDDFYLCFFNHKIFIDKYLPLISSLRNKFIHGYSVNLEHDTTHNEYVIKNRDTTIFPILSDSRINSDLILSNFTKAIMTNTRLISTDIINLFERKLSYGATKIPM